MKFLLVVALLAGVHADADAEADPQLLLAGTPLVYGAAHAVVHTPVVKTVEVKPVEVKTTPLVYSYTGFPYAGHFGYPYVFGHGLPVTVAAPAEEEAPAVESERKKREAEPEADPEADPWYLAYGYHTPVVYNAPVVKKVEVKTTPVVYNSLVHPYTYGHYGYPYAGVYGHYGYPYVYGHGLPLTVAAPAEAAEEEAPAVETERKKREAEPEADPEADPWYLTYGYHAPVVYKAPVVKKVEVKTTPVVYNSLVHPYTYGHYGYPYAYSGYHYPYTYGYHVVPAAAPAEEAEAAVESERKRRDADADAEADPAVLASYSRILNPAPVTYTVPAVTHGVYAGYAGYPYAYGHLGYGYGLYGK